MNKLLVSRRRFLASGSAALSAPLLLQSRLWAAPGGASVAVDVCVYGGTSGGVMAAIALGRLGRSVAIVEPTRHLGGMTSGGLGWIDVQMGGVAAYGSLTGDYYRRIRQHYTDAGIDVNQFGNRGAVAEPHVAEAILEQMLAEQGKHVTVYRESRLGSVRKEGRRLKTITLDKAPVDRRGAPAPEAQEHGYVRITAQVFLDCSYEGDLMAAAGVAHRTDREAAGEYGESYGGVLASQKTEFGAPLGAMDPYVKPGDPSSGLIPLISKVKLGASGARSPVVQAFNFRLCLVKENPIAIEPGSNYRPEQYELVARALAALKAAGEPLLPEQMHRIPSPRFLKISHLPNGKTDVNNQGPVSMDYVTGGAELYAAASWARRAAMWHAHEDYQRGFLYFVRTDPRVDAAVRNDIAQWGLPRDEFKDTGGWPTQLYVREARRMVGAYVIRQSDCERPAKEVQDSIGLGTYSLDSHACQRLADGGKVVTEGLFYEVLPGPYPLTYRSLTPRPEECENLLVTFCVSSTHVSFASIRMEPPFMVMSESAAHAAHMAITGGTSVQSIAMDALARRLRAVGQIVLPEQIGHA
jgi:hypothetical protein